MLLTWSQWRYGASSEGRNFRVSPTARITSRESAIAWAAARMRASWGVAWSSPKRRIGTGAYVDQHLDAVLAQQGQKRLQRVIGMPDRPDGAGRAGRSVVHDDSPPKAAAAAAKQPRVQASELACHPAKFRTLNPETSNSRIMTAQADELGECTRGGGQLTPLPPPLPLPLPLHPRPSPRLHLRPSLRLPSRLPSPRPRLHLRRGRHRLRLLPRARRRDRRRLLPLPLPRPLPRLPRSLLRRSPRCRHHPRRNRSSSSSCLVEDALVAGPVVVAGLGHGGDLVLGKRLLPRLGGDEGFHVRLLFRYKGLVGLVREFVQLSQSEDLQELFGGSVQERPAEFVGSAHDSHQVAFDQLAKHFARLHAADGFDFRPQHRLPIGHHGQGFHGRGRQPDFRRCGVQPPQPRGELRPRHQLKTARHLLHAKRTSFGIVPPVQGSD